MSNLNPYNHVPKDLVRNLDAAKKDVSDYLDSLGLKGRDAILKKGPFKGRRCQITSVSTHRKWKSDDVEITISYKIYKVKEEGFLCTYHNAQLRRYIGLDEAELI